MKQEPPSGRIRLTGLSRAEAAELDDLLSERPLPGDVLRIEEEVLPPHRLGEPATFMAIAALAGPALSVLMAFLMRARKREHLRYRAEVEYPDGSRRSEELELSRSEDEAPDSELIEKLASLTQRSTDQIAALIE